MNIFEWENRYAIGVTQIDEHHRHLVDLLNRTYEDFIAYTPSEQLNVLLDELIDYATYHFSAEEQLMQEKGYPGLEVQKKEHGEFTGRVVEMYADYRNGRKVLFLEILTFLRHWLGTHILVSDAALGRFLTAEATNRSSDTRRENASA
jgi:hemerythrin